MNNKLSNSYQGPQNTIPFYNPMDNLNYPNNNINNLKNTSIIEGIELLGNGNSEIKINNKYAPD